MGLSVAQLTQFTQQFGKYYVRQFAAVLARTGLTMRDIRVLLFLANNPALDTARDVAECRGIPKSQVSQAVEVLVGRGLLERRPDRTDRRVVRLRITEAGAPLAWEAQEIQAACGARLLECLAETEREQFLDLLEKVLERANCL